jgi:hypothetical protein
MPIDTQETGGRDGAGDLGEALRDGVDRLVDKLQDVGRQGAIELTEQEKLLIARHAALKAALAGPSVRGAAGGLTITLIDPASAPRGTDVTIQADRVGDVIGVTFGPARAAFQIKDFEIKTTVPQEAPLGAIQVAIFTPSAAATGAFEVLEQ